MKDKKYIVIAGAVLVIAAAAGWLFTRYYLSPPGPVKQPLVEMSDGAPNSTGAMSSEETVTVKIFSPSPNGMSVQEKRVQNSQLPVKMAEAVLTEYLKDLGEECKDTKLLGVYRDRNNVFYVDLSDEFRRNFSGDADREYLLLKSLYDTVAANIPGTEDLKVLIEGKEVESIGGHLGSLYPLKETVKD